MAHRLERRAALTAAGLATLLLAGAAGAQTPSNDFRQCSRYLQDDRHDSVYLPGGCFWTADPAARPGDVPTTGTLGTPGSGLPAAGIAGPGTVAVPLDGSGNRAVRGGTQPGSVSGPVPGGSTGSTLERRTAPDGTSGPVAGGGTVADVGNRSGGSAPGRADDAASPGSGGSNSGRGAGNDRDGKNNNGLGNGSEPADGSARDTKGSDPSNPAHGGGAAGDRGGNGPGGGHGDGHGGGHGDGHGGGHGGGHK